MSSIQALSQSSKGHYVVSEHADRPNKGAPSLSWQVRFIHAFLIRPNENVIDARLFGLFMVSLGYAYRVDNGSMLCVTLSTDYLCFH